MYITHLSNLILISSQFNLAQWFDEASPSVVDCRTLLDYVFHGIKFCGQSSSFEEKALLGVSNNHNNNNK